MATGYEHASKRQRTDNGEMSRQGQRKPQPSVVVHVRSLADNVGENDLIDAVRKFGPVVQTVLNKRNHEALIEFEDLESAVKCVAFSQENPVFVGPYEAFFSYHTSNRIDRSMDGGHGGGHSSGGGPENHILLFTVQNPLYPITVEVMNQICSPYGDVQRIVVFEKSSVQAMVEFDSIDSARKAKSNLNGADIYSGCCTLKIDFAKPTRLNVYKNDSESWDYTNPNLGSGRGGDSGGPRSAALLGDAPSGGRGFGGHQQDYEMYDDGYNGYGRPPPGAMGRGGGMMRGRGRGRGGGMGGPPRGGNDYDGYGGGYDGYGGGYGRPFDGHRGPMGMDLNDPTISAGSGSNPQQGGVLMVYGVAKKINCDKLFNLFCLYGNVISIKFLKSKEGVCMVQMGDGFSAERVIQNLTNSFIFDSKIQIQKSKQAYLQHVQNPSELEDGTTSFKEYMSSRNNRYTNADAASKNRIQPPAKVLHYFNAPPSLTEEEINKLFEDSGAVKPSKIKIFPSKSEKSSTGLVEFANKSEAMEALCCTNHYSVPNPNGKHPYIFKLCFSSAPIMG